MGTFSFGGQGLFLQTVEGDGEILVNSGGPPIHSQGAPCQRIAAHPSAVGHLYDRADLAVTRNAGLANVLFGDESLWVAKMQGLAIMVTTP